MTRSLSELIGLLKELPGIGEKSAQRIARYILKLRNNEAQRLSSAILAARIQTHACERCGNLTEDVLCRICSDSSREKYEICVVEEAFDIPVIENSGVYRGQYHVLGGVLSPVDDVSPDSLRIKELLERTKKENIREVILAISATTEGEATASYIAEILKGSGIRVSRIARGIPVGSDIGLADEVTIEKAMRGREFMNESGNG
ncbi:recombination protein RecR [bacterium]|nr:recombination protein RecR [bacterium]